MLITLFGPPGCGKSTLGDRLEDELGFRHLALGRMIRSGELSHEVGLDPKTLAQAVAQGTTISSPKLFSWLNRIVCSMDRVVVDGYPREPNALVPFNELARSIIRERTVLALDLTCPLDKVLRRLASRNRLDDHENLVRARYQEYTKTQYPLLAGIDAVVTRSHLDAGNLSENEIWTETCNIVSKMQRFV